MDFMGYDRGYEEDLRVADRLFHYVLLLWAFIDYQNSNSYSLNSTFFSSLSDLLADYI